MYRKKVIANKISERYKDTSIYSLNVPSTEKTPKTLRMEKGREKRKKTKKIPCQGILLKSSFVSSQKILNDINLYYHYNENWLFVNDDRLTG
jgi:hypothetical protein